MQLPSGELPAAQWSDAGDAYLAPAPLLSALAHDALGYVDPRSPLFVGVRELLPPSFFRTIVSLRWGLRLYIASEEEADATWRLHGRTSGRNADVTSTACGAAALLPAARSRNAKLDRRHMNALRMLAAGREWTPIEAAHALRYLSLIGADTSSLAARVRRDAESVSPTAAYVHAVATALPAVTFASSATNVDGRLAQALATAARLDSGQHDSTRGDVLDRILFDTTPPWLWHADPYHDTRIGSPAAALAIRIANVARLVAMPRRERG